MLGNLWKNRISPSNFANGQIQGCWEGSNKIYIVNRAQYSWRQILVYFSHVLGVYVRHFDLISNPANSYIVNNPKRCVFPIFDAIFTFFLFYFIPFNFIFHWFACHPLKPPFWFIYTPAYLVISVSDEVFLLILFS